MIVSETWKGLDCIAAQHDEYIGGTLGVIVGF